MIHALDDLAPTVGQGAWIAPDARVIGRVSLGPEASVWFGAVLRGDVEPISVGPGTNVQEHCVLHTDEGFPLSVGPECTIGHRAILHGCTVGAGCLVGMGAIVLNGAVVGAGSLVGAGALVTEGTVIPEGSLVVGAPAKVRRSLDGAARGEILASARRYRANAARFRDGLGEGRP